MASSIYREYFVVNADSSWKTGTVGDLCTNIYSGGTPDTAKSEYWNGKFPWLSSGETRNKFIIGTDKTITKDGIAFSSTKLAHKNDIVMASAGQGLTRGQTSYLFLDTYINQSVVVLSGKPEVQSYIFINLSNRYDELRGISDSSSIRGSITTKMLKKFPVILPRQEVVFEFSEITKPIFDQIKNNLFEADRLRCLRDSLLPKLMSGEIDVSQISN